MTPEERKAWEELVFSTEGYIGAVGGGFVTDQHDRVAILAAAEHIKRLEGAVEFVMRSLDGGNIPNDPLVRPMKDWVLKMRTELRRRAGGG